MEWHIYFVVSVLFFIGSIVLAIVRARAEYKSGRILDPLKLLFIGVALSSITLFIPFYSVAFSEYDCSFIEVILGSVHNMIRLFVVDGESDFVTTHIPGELPFAVRKAYAILFSVLFVTAPILTFNFVMSFFKNVSAYRRYIAHFKTDAFIFSQLNKKSLALAESLHKNNKKRLIVFADMIEENRDKKSLLMEKAKEIGAVCFKKDVMSVGFSIHSKKSNVTFFAIGEDQSDNTSLALKLIEKYKSRDNTDLYVFSSLVETEMVLSNAFSGDNNEIRIKTRRVNEIQSFIAQNLYNSGYENVFCTAYDNGSPEKQINAVVLGMDSYGTEMTKALAWFCQMDGYSVNIDAFDPDPSAEEKFRSICPELMEFSGKTDIEGEARYTINIHPGVNFDTASFDDCIMKLPRATYLFVSAGNDESNISLAVKMRSLFEGAGYDTFIQAIVSDSDKKEALTDIVNFNGQKYNIDFIGDIKSCYSEETVLRSEVEAQALKRHLRWSGESSFWRFNYNYKSSVASAIHYKMKKLCGIPGIEREPEGRTEEERRNIRILEHRRWNAYIRSEGYTYGGSTDKSVRNDMAKRHNCLVAFGNLPLKEQTKDDD